MAKLKTGDPAPAFEAVDQDGNMKTLADYRGRKLILYFYQKDNTPGCTKEACDFRDSFNRLTGKATVIGVSPDDIESHKKFRNDHSINFILLSDPNRELAEKFGALEAVGEHGAKINRSTFIIKDGLVSKAWKNVKVEGHVDEVLASL